MKIRLEKPTLGGKNEKPRRGFFKCWQMVFQLNFFYLNLRKRGQK